MSDTVQSTGEILDFAIAREEESFAFYRALAQQSETPRMRDMFEGFAREELAHKEKLAMLKQGRALALAPGKTASLAIADYVVQVTPSASMRYQDALRLAMQREKAAFRLYTVLAEQAADEDARTIFLILSQEEARHALRFEIEYDDFVTPEN